MNTKALDIRTLQEVQGEEICEESQGEKHMMGLMRQKSSPRER
jgi:hypothetical protein